MDLGADDEHPVVGARLDEGVAHLQGVEEAAALGAEVDAGDVAGVDRLVQEERCAGEVVFA